MAEVPKDPSTVTAQVKEVACNLPAEQASLLNDQINIINTQYQSLLSAIDAFKAATGKDPLQTNPVDLASPKQQQVQPDGQPDKESESTVKDNTIKQPPPEWEELSASLFSIADTLTPTMMHALSHILGCSEGLLRIDYNKQRTSVRNFLQRVQKKAANTQLQSSVTTDSNTHAADDLPSQLSQHDDSGLEKLHSLLDESGSINQAYLADKLVVQMQTASTYNLKSAQLSAILASTNRSVLIRFSNSRFMDALDGWVRAAEEDQQTSFLVQVLRVLAHVPPSLTSTRTSLQKTIRRLTHNRSPRITHLSTLLLQLFHAQDTGNATAADNCRTQIMGSGKPGRENRRPSAAAAGAAAGAAAASTLSTSGLIPVGKGHQKANAHKRSAPQRPLFDAEREKKRQAMMLAAKQRQQGEAATTAQRGGAAGPSSGPHPEPPHNSRHLPPPPSDRGRVRDADRPPLPIPVKPLGAVMQPPPPPPRRRGPHHPDVEAAEQLYKQQQHKWLAQRHKYAANEVHRRNDTLRCLGAMAPTLFWYTPLHLAPSDPTSPPAQGEESVERQIQRAREATTVRAQYTRWEEIPSTPQEFPKMDSLPTKEPPPIPYTPLDPAEDKVQNAAMWAKGVRLSQYIWVPDSLPSGKTQAVEAQAPSVAAPQYVALAPPAASTKQYNVALQYAGAPVQHGHGAAAAVAVQTLEQQQLLAQHLADQQQRHQQASALQQQQLLGLQQQAAYQQQQYVAAVHQPQQQQQYHLQQHEAEQYHRQHLHQQHHAATSHEQQLLALQQQQQQQLVYTTGYYSQYAEQQQQQQQQQQQGRGQYGGGGGQGGYDVNRQHQMGYGYLG